MTPHSFLPKRPGQFQKGLFNWGEQDHINDRTILPAHHPDYLGKTSSFAVWHLYGNVEFFYYHSKVAAL